MHVFRPEVDDFQSVFKAELSVFPSSHQMALTRIHYPTTIIFMSGYNRSGPSAHLSHSAADPAVIRNPSGNYIRLTCKYLGPVFTVFPNDKKEKNTDALHAECCKRLSRVNFLLRFQTELKSMSEFTTFRPETLVLFYICSKRTETLFIVYHLQSECKAASCK